MKEITLQYKMNSFPRSFEYWVMWSVVVKSLSEINPCPFELQQYGIEKLQKHESLTDEVRNLNASVKHTSCQHNYFYPRFRYGYENKHSIKKHRTERVRRKRCFIFCWRLAERSKYDCNIEQSSIICMQWSCYFKYSCHGYTLFGWNSKTRRNSAVSTRSNTLNAPHSVSRTNSFIWKRISSLKFTFCLSQDRLTG